MKALKPAFQRIAPINMAQIFSGLHVAFAELPNDSKARILFTKKVESGGGSVMVARPGAFFGSKGPLPPEITHIILDSKNLTIKQLKKKLNCDDISPDVRIVHNNWLIESVAKSSRLDESEYIIEINEQDTDMQMKSGRDVNSSADGEANSSSNKKQKISSTDSGTSVGQVSVDKYPIIPNPISFPDFTPIYGSWQEYKSVMYKFNDPANSVSSDQPAVGTEACAALSAYIAFDMDGTIITPKSGKKFGVDEFDWKFWDKAVPDVLLKHHREGKTLAIISNQNGIVTKNVTKLEVQRKVDSVLASVGIPMDFICATEDDGFKKPRTGMWDILRYMWAMRDRGSLSEGKTSFTYVGDAADLKMALNAGIYFETPEKFFLNASQRIHSQFDVSGSIRLCDVPRSPEYPTNLFTPPSGSLEIVLLIAPAACGKSTITRRFDSSLYSRVNQDSLRTIDRCITTATQEIKKGLNIVVDNTNIAVETRAHWIALAKREGVQIRCIVLRTPKEVCFSLAALRLADPSTPQEDRREISKIVIHSGFKYLVLPTEKEREVFARVDEVNWSPTLPQASRQLSEALASKDDSAPLSSTDDVTLKLLCSYLK